LRPSGPSVGRWRGGLHPPQCRNPHGLAGSMPWDGFARKPGFGEHWPLSGQRGRWLKASTSAFFLVFVAFAVLWGDGLVTSGPSSGNLMLLCLLCFSVFRSHYSETLNSTFCAVVKWSIPS
jgi:hypothetical protein